MKKYMSLALLGLCWAGLPRSSAAPVPSPALHQAACFVQSTSVTWPPDMRVPPGTPWGPGDPRLQSPQAGPTIPMYTPQSPPPYKGAPGYYLIPDFPGGASFVPLNLGEGKEPFRANGPPPPGVGPAAPSPAPGPGPMPNPGPNGPTPFGPGYQPNQGPMMPSFGPPSPFGPGYRPYPGPMMQNLAAPPYPFPPGLQNYPGPITPYMPPPYPFGPGFAPYPQPSPYGSYPGPFTQNAMPPSPYGPGYQPVGPGSAPPMNPAVNNLPPRDKMPDPAGYDFVRDYHGKGPAFVPRTRGYAVYAAPPFDPKAPPAIDPSGYQYVENYPRVGTAFVPRNLGRFPVVPIIQTRDESSIPPPLANPVPPPTGRPESSSNVFPGQPGAYGSEGPPPPSPVETSDRMNQVTRSPDPARSFPPPSELPPPDARLTDPDAASRPAPATAAGPSSSLPPPVQPQAPTDGEPPLASQQPSTFAQGTNSRPGDPRDLPEVVPLPGFEASGAAGSKGSNKGGSKPPLPSSDGFGSGDFKPECNTLFPRGAYTFQVLAGYYRNATTPAYNYIPISLRLGKLCDCTFFDNTILRGVVEPIVEVNGAPTMGIGSAFVGSALLMRYNFVQPECRLVPYVQVGVGLQYNNAYRDDTQAALGQGMELTTAGQLGLRWFWKPNVSFDVEGGYTVFNNFSQTTRNDGIHALGGSVGMTYYFPIARQ